MKRCKKSEPEAELSTLFRKSCSAIVAPMFAGKTTLARRLREEVRCNRNASELTALTYLPTVCDVDDFRVPKLESELKVLRRKHDWEAHNRMWYPAVSGGIAGAYLTGDLEAVLLHDAYLFLGGYFESPRAIGVSVPSAEELEHRWSARTAGRDPKEATAQGVLACMNIRAIARSLKLMKQKFGALVYEVDFARVKFVPEMDCFAGHGACNRAVDVDKVLPSIGRVVAELAMRLRACTGDSRFDQFVSSGDPTVEFQS